jgi:elongation factor 3
MPIAVETTVDEISQQMSQLLSVCANAKTTEERKSAADELAGKVGKTVGAQKAFHNYGLVDSILSTYADKKNAGAKEGALMAISSIAALVGQAAMPYLISTIPLTLEGLCDRQKNVARAGKTAFQAVVDTVATTPNAAKAILPHLLAALGTDRKWEGKVAALGALVNFAKTASTQIDRALPEIIPEVSQCMWDSKPEVQKAATRALSAVCGTVTNPDLRPFIPQLVATIEQPNEVPETVYKLAATTFVTTVEAPSLAIMAPILQRGLAEASQAILRQTAVIIDNMCKLVEDPIHAEQFLPKLLPGLNRTIDVAADPELRAVATKAKATLVRVGGGKEDIVIEDYTTKTRRQLDSAIVAIKKIVGQVNAAALPLFDTVALDYLAYFATALDDVRDYNDAAWAKMSPILEAFVVPAQAAEIYSTLNAHFVDENAKRGVKIVDVDPEEGEELCNCEFSLAYGGMILLNNTKLRLTRGQRYGLCGPNGAGKSTLMRAISNGQLDGFPTADVLKTVFVEHNLQASDAEKSVIDFVLTDEAFVGKDQAKIIATLQSVGFDEEKRAMFVGALSGGWKMKLELARAMLMEADILLLDEPTNHLDVYNVAWLTKYLTSLKDVTSIIVSHDSGFLDDVCSHIIHYEYRKLKTYKGNLSEFVKVKPEAKSYYTLSESAFSFKLPEPGFLEGVKSKDRAILKMMKVGYQYPSSTKPTITGISVQCSLNSRVAVVGPNGAGKSTVIKVLTGEVEPTSGDVWKHPNMRVAYVAQHAFHHIEQHLDKSPNEYIRWRFQNGEDRELAAKITRQLTPEEEQRLKVPIVIDSEKRVIETFMGRRNAKRGFEYEIKWTGKPWEDNTWLSREKLEDMGLEKFLKIYDDKEAAREGLYARPLTSVNVQKHLQDLGLEPEFSTHSRIRGLSGGQKVKVVLGACMWDQPHIVVLDEPTNYLDRDSLGALAQAIKGYGGGVIMVSHHSEFTNALCLETWTLNNGQLQATGTSTPGGVAEKIEMKEETEKTDAFGNTSKVKSTKVLTNKEKKAKQRRKALKIKNGEPLSSDEEDDI